jgi:hypothetical protein
VEATDDALVAGFWADLVAEFVVTPCGLLEGADRFGVVMEVDERCCHDVDRPAKMLDLAPRHPCTFRSALQARWKHFVTVL